MWCEIVERLRADGSDLSTEAADEIERLVPLDDKVYAIERVLGAPPHQWNDYVICQIEEIMGTQLYRRPTLL